MRNETSDEFLPAPERIGEEGTHPGPSRGVESAAESQPVMLLVLGAHRSGTSLTARMLECLGAQNSPNLSPANEYNPKGYFEDWDVYQFNEYKLLPQLGASWQSLGPIDWLRLDGAVLAELRAEACEILRRNYQLDSGQLDKGQLDKGQRVLKEPRIARLLPFWLPVLREVGFEVKIVLAVRDPLSAALSLSKRDGLSIPHAAMIYLASWRSIFIDAVELPTALIQYEDILASPGSALRGIASRLSLELPADFESRLAEFAERDLDPDLCHSRATPEQVLADARIPGLVARCYEALFGATASQDAAPFAAAAASIEATLAPLDPVLVEFDRLHEGRQQALDQIRTGSDRLKAGLEANATLERNREELQASLLDARHLERRLSVELQREREAKDAAIEEIASASNRHTQALSEISRLYQARTAQNLRAEQAETYAQRLEKQVSVLQAARTEESSRHWAEAEQSARRVSDLESLLDEVYRSRSWRLSASVRLLESIPEFRPGQLRRWKISLQILSRHRHSGLFDAAWYLRQNPDCKATAEDPFIHFALIGVFENRTPNPYFDKDYYLSINPDVLVDPVVHYALWGFSENRSCCPLFDNDFYASEQPELAAGQTNFLAHYAGQGWREGKNPHPLFHAGYCASQGRLQDGGLPWELNEELEEPLARYLHGGWLRGMNPHPFFDATRYLRDNPDVREADVDPLHHFFWNGAFEGRSPCEFFDCETVFRRCPQLAAKKVNPLVFYLHHPWQSDPHPEFTLAMCLEQASPGQAQQFGSRAEFLPPRAVAGRPLGQVDTSKPQGSDRPPKSDLRAIALYLPQFHTIPENDQWWGKGFTEWTNVRRGAPRYDGHYQPHVPHPDLGYYDLNDESVMEKQVQSARSAGIEGFCFYYYWFNGRRLLDMPIDRMLATGKPDFPFCYCWANENWTRRWDGRDEEILMAQTHSAECDERFITELLPVFRDPRYIRINGRPLLVVYRPGLFPDPAATARIWRRVCEAAGVGEIHLAFMQGFDHMEAEEIGFDTAIQFPPLRSNARQIQDDLPLHNPRSFTGMVFDYRELVVNYATAARAGRAWPAVCPSWDNTARTGDRAHSWINASPRNYRLWLSQVAADLRDRQLPEERIVFINAWNEWAEGNHLEPDVKDGYAWLNATKDGLRLPTACNAPPRNASLARNPSVATARLHKLEALVGGSLPHATSDLLLDHTALLSVFQQRGHQFTREGGRLTARAGERSIPLSSRDALVSLSETLWGNSDSLPFCFVLLQYNKWEHTRKCVESIRRLRSRGHVVHIVIVDNASTEEAVVNTRGLFANARDVSLIFNDENLGFARGNNVGYRYAKQRFADAFVVVMNNDVVIEDAEFLAKCSALYRQQLYSVLGPDVVTPDGRRENPWNDYVYSIEEWNELRDLFLEQREAYLSSGVARFERTGERTPAADLIQDPLLQGSCYVFSPIFVDCHEQPFDESSFLYGEEFPLSVNCLLGGHLSLYSSALAIRHEEGASTGLITDRQKMLYGYNGALNGIDLASTRLERQDSAVSGSSLELDAAQIRTLTSDGRKHVLVDLLFCQPGFHGGGEYGKAVFRGLVESAVHLPNVQLWAAFDPDLYIDDWIRDDCRKFGINVVRVSSHDDIVSLVNLGCFFSFFAPAIVIYTGYEYMKRIGGDLKFSEHTKTHIIGTLLDLRDLELAANWEAIAEARKTAGVRPEIDFTGAQWQAEKTRQERHAQQLAEMYRRICSSKTLTSLVTISEYSAQSIKRIAQAMGSIQVLFAPEKPRPHPEPFVHAGVDFEDDPFLLVVNVERPEKNAASVVAAFESLLSDPEFAVANPDLKLVLVGIGQLDNLPMRLLLDRQRIVPLPHLAPGQFEYVLSKSRGLVYPSFSEGFGYPPVEAMSRGVPCVVSDVTAIPEVCAKAAIYCDPFSVQSIATAMKNLLGCPPAPETLRAHAAATKARQVQDLGRLANLICSGVVSDSAQEQRPHLHTHSPSFHAGYVLRRKGWCPICEKEVMFASKNKWLRDHYFCVACGSIPRERAIMQVIQTRYPDWRKLRIHECSPVGRGASVKLREQCAHYIASQYDPELGFGNMHPEYGYFSEDLENQSFADAEFDLVITQDVMEHVLDAEAAFREIYRTLKPGGSHIFTTPLVNGDNPSERRAERAPDGSIVHLAPPEYHGNPMSSDGSLVTWHWGRDIVNHCHALEGVRVRILDVSEELFGIEGAYTEVIVITKDSLSVSEPAASQRRAKRPGRLRSERFGTNG